MSEASTVPLTITPEASAHIAQLKMRREFEQLEEHLGGAVPGLRAVEVSLAPPCDPGDDPRVLVVAVMEPSVHGYDPTQKELGQWLVRTFPAEVCRHFCVLNAYGGTDEG